MKTILLFAALIATFSIGSVQSCDAWDWIKCGGIVATCAAACVEPLDPLCVDCLGEAYDQCKSCIGLNNDINALMTLQGAQNQTCSSSSWVQCGADLIDCEVVCEENFTSPQCTTCLLQSYDDCVYCLPQIADPNLKQQLEASCSPWDWLKCAAKIPECVGTCGENGITSQQCITCFGSAYDQCKGCLAFDAAVQQQDLRQGCSTFDWLYCAGSLAKCTVECISTGITSPQCFNCLGSGYNQCIKCISSESKEDIKQLAIAHQAAVMNGVPKQQYCNECEIFSAIVPMGVAMKMVL